MEIYQLAIAGGVAFVIFLIVCVIIYVRNVRAGRENAYGGQAHGAMRTSPHVPKPAEMAAGKV